MINSRNSKLLVVLFVLQGIIIPVFSQSYTDRVHFPKSGEKMPIESPLEAGLDTTEFNNLANAVSPKIKMAGGQPDSDYGLLICRGEKIVRTWGNIDFKYQSDSLNETSSTYDMLLFDTTYTVKWSAEARFNGCWIVSLPMKPGMAGDWAERNWHKDAHYKGSVTIIDMQRPFSINSGIAEAKVGSGEIGRHSAFEISRSITKPGTYYFSQGTPYSHTPHPPGKEGTDFHNMNSIFFIISKQYQMWTAEAFARDSSYYPITLHYKLYLSFE